MLFRVCYPSHCNFGSSLTHFLRYPFTIHENVSYQLRSQQKCHWTLHLCPFYDGLLSLLPTVLLCHRPQGRCLVDQVVCHVHLLYSVSRTYFASSGLFLLLLPSNHCNLYQLLFNVIIHRKVYKSRRKRWPFFHSQKSSRKFLPHLSSYLSNCICYRFLLSNCTVPDFFSHFLPFLISML